MSRFTLNLAAVVVWVLLPTAAQSPEPSDNVCGDISGWVDKIGNSCASYASLGWCSNPPFDAKIYAVNGVSSHEACRTTCPSLCVNNTVDRHACASATKILVDMGMRVTGAGGLDKTLELYFAANLSQYLYDWDPIEKRSFSGTLCTLEPYIVCIACPYYIVCTGSL